MGYNLEKNKKGTNYWSLVNQGGPITGMHVPNSTVGCRDNSQSKMHTVFGLFLCPYLSPMLMDLTENRDLWNIFLSATLCSPPHATCLHSEVFVL